MINRHHKMFKLNCIFLLPALLAANAVLINNNKNIDRVTSVFNEHLRQTGATFGPFPELNISPNVSYSNATIIGIDSLVRTGDCWADLPESEIKLMSHYGFGLLTLVFPHLTIDGQNMSGLVRIHNSICTAFTTLYHIDNCTIILDEFQVERLQDIEFQSSVAEYDGKNLDNFFQSQVVPALNRMLVDLKPKIETDLQVLCGPSHHQYTIETLSSQFITLNLTDEFFKL